MAQNELIQIEPADKAHRLQIERDAISDLMNTGMNEPSAKHIIGLIAAGSVSHVTINY